MATAEMDLSEDLIQS
jgi:hypothetical protein